MSCTGAWLQIYRVEIPSRTQIRGCTSLPHDTILSWSPDTVLINKKQQQGAVLDIMALTAMGNPEDHGRVHAPCVCTATHLATASQHVSDRDPI